MKEKTNLNFVDLTSKMRIFEDEQKKISEFERTKNSDNLSRTLIQLDKKQAGIGIADIKLIDKKTINYEAARVLEPSSASISEAAIQLQPSITSELLGLKEISCDCIIPFCFDQLRANGKISGPSNNNVTRGVIGANRYYENEYRVFNAGDTKGKTRIHSVGSLDILFSAEIPKNGRYCLLMPVGKLWIRGKSRVVGQGNSTTSYDSKVWVDYFSILHVEGNIIESSHADIHYDGTRSEDRTKYFSKDISFSPRYLFFNANAQQKVELILRIQIDTAANEDGKAWGYVNLFGFPANMKTDYDTMIIKA
jgi:hypothetical protein